MEKPDFSNLSAVYVNCTLKKSPKQSHTATLMEVSKKIMKTKNVKIDEIRLVDYPVASGVYPDMKSWEEDAWPWQSENHTTRAARAAAKLYSLRPITAYKVQV